MSTVFRCLLWPLALLYGLASEIRNFLYESGVLKSKKAPLRTLVVGNLRVGGTGKTPFVEWLAAHFLQQGVEFCILSRGYGRKTKGFMEASRHSTYKDIGDEPMQYFTKFASKGVKVFVGEDRVNAIEQIHERYGTISLIILDDAFQHRRLLADHYILLTEFGRPFYHDFLLPYGRLRELRKGARRASAVVVTKSPEEALNFKDSVTNGMAKYKDAKSLVFFNGIRYGNLRSLFNYSLSLFIEKVILVCGIANPTNFVSYCEGQYKVQKIFTFPDHYDFKESDVVSIVREAHSLGENATIITTEKDAMRLVTYSELFKNCQVAYLPISNYFLEGESSFKEMLNTWYN